MKLGFGRYHYRDLDRIPTGYLAWVLQNVDDLAPDLRLEIKLIVAERLGLEVLEDEAQEARR